MPVSSLFDTDVDDLVKLGRRLKEAGDKELRRELFKALNRATRPLKLAAKESALTSLPNGGGLNVWVAKNVRIGTRNRLAGRNPGVRIQADRKGSDIAAMNRGRLRHPVFGNRQVWVTQQIRPGWFSRPMAAGAPAVRRELNHVLEDFAGRLERGSLNL